MCKCVPSRQNGKDSNKLHIRTERGDVTSDTEMEENQQSSLFTSCSTCLLCVEKTSTGEPRAVRKRRNKGNQPNRLNNSSLGH